MDTEAWKLWQRRTTVMKALANTSRFFMVEMLSGHERCVNELTERIESDISPVSLHLRILRNAGIIARKKRGSFEYYVLRLAGIRDFLRCTDAVLEQRRLREEGGENQMGMVIRPRIEEEICE